MSWAMCQPARVEWQSPQCLVNQACGQKKGGGKKQKGHQVVNNSKKPSQCRSDIYVNELQHPQ